MSTEDRDTTASKEVVTSSTKGPGALLGFFDALNVSRAFEDSGWNIERHVKRLVQIIDDPESDPRVVLAAAEILRKHAFDSLQFTAQQHGRVGNPVVVAALPESDMKLLEAGAARTQAILQQDTPVQGVQLEDDNDDCQTEDHDGERESDGRYDTEEVVGHRPPPAGVRQGLCAARPDDRGGS